MEGPRFAVYPPANEAALAIVVCSYLNSLGGLSEFSGLSVRFV